MKIVRSVSGAGPELQTLVAGGAVGLTIGNFDGLHLGHQALFQKLDDLLSDVPAERRRKGLVTFAPHPRQVLSGLSRSEVKTREEFFTVLTIRDKLDLISDYGFDFTYVIRFRPAFASLTPEQFVEHLAQSFSPKCIVVGDDWSFGKGRSGTALRLRELGEQRGIQTGLVDGVTLDGTRVSTSAVKAAIRSADFPLLRRLLGRSYSVSGRVEPGARKGRELGFPTANLEFRGIVLPPDGIYSTWIHVEGARLPAAAYIGPRPTYGGGHRVLEVHLLAPPPSGYDLYRKRIEVEFADFIRGDKHFESEQELRAAIAADVTAVSAKLGANKP